jgi:hypothetical protein
MSMARCGGGVAGRSVLDNLETSRCYFVGVAALNSLFILTGAAWKLEKKSSLLSSHRNLKPTTTCIVDLSIIQRPWKAI